MKDYIRQIKIKYKYKPYLLVLRLLLDISIILLDCWYATYMLLIFGIFSTSVRFISEEEYILPLNDEEIKFRRLNDVKAVVIRTFILGAINLIKCIFFPGLCFGDVSGIGGRPFIFAALLLLLVSTLFEGVLESVMFKEPKKNKSASDYFISFVSAMPVIVITVYYYDFLIHGDESDRLLDLGSEWIHVILILVLAFTQVVIALKKISKWKTHDYDPRLQRAKNNRR